ncbi:hypothetical protein I6M49_22105 [Shewanella algae]|uniref:hypothetical protein n=1 Tax=Shewanella algae TaxID=38313 RepID=UPI001AACFDD6|nr:hypothetical protein [Shewanella algae]MBO2656139.1 hypothetical protein [Shewanella algae]
MVSIASLLLATVLANAAVPVKYEHRPYELEQMKIYLKGQAIYDLEHLQPGFVAKEGWGYKNLDQRSVQQKLVDKLYTDQVKAMAINHFDFNRSGLSSNEADTAYGEKVGKAVYETQYLIKPLDVYVIYGLPSSVLKK